MFDVSLDGPYLQLRYYPLYKHVLVVLAILENLVSRDTENAQFFIIDRNRFDYSYQKYRNINYLFYFCSHIILITAEIYLHFR